MHAANERRLHGHMAAVRITTEKVPEGLGSIAQLPDPTQGEVQGCWALLQAVVAELGLSGIDAVPILKDPDMFQVVARQALGLGLNTRLFDKKATETPKYTQGLRDGYRKGFLEGRRRADTEDLLGQCEESGDELEFMTAYFEYSR
ncbi:hypothetical protein GGF46_004150 [Coemansia sp. RSA 552]|nr:hypothetical protein GGF46_004150 [Coemansia sp. RSA 552]